jgi:hypothetical protein
MTESKEVYGMTLYKCQGLKNTWLTERGCLTRQNQVRQELLENYPQIKYLSKCLTCADGKERAERLNYNLIDVSSLFNDKEKTRKRSNTAQKRSVCSVKNLNPYTSTLAAERKALALGYNSLADCLNKEIDNKTQAELGEIFGVCDCTIGYWYKKLDIKAKIKTCSIPGIVPTKRTFEIEENAKKLGYESLADCLKKEADKMSHNQIGRLLDMHPGSVSGYMKRLKNDGRKCGTKS